MIKIITRFEQLQDLNYPEYWKDCYIIDKDGNRAGVLEYADSMEKFFISTQICSVEGFEWTCYTEFTITKDWYTIKNRKTGEDKTLIKNFFDDFTLIV